MLDDDEIIENISRLPTIIVVIVLIITLIGIWVLKMINKISIFFRFKLKKK